MKGDTAAQVELGKLYYYGRGVEQNLVSRHGIACHGQTGDVRRLNWLGMWRYLASPPSSCRAQLKAASYFEVAARAGEPVAAGFMGHMYIMGIGVEQNNDTALAYLTQGERAQ